MALTEHFTKHFDSPINAIDLCPDQELLAVVGKSTFKVFKIKEDGSLSDEDSLRPNIKFRNLNYNSIDVKFAPSDSSRVASATMNGSIMIWSIASDDKIRATHNYKDTNCAVNKVNFHPVDSNMLLISSQDGLMKLFDCRTDEIATTFSSNCEKIWDIQFNPIVPHYFAIGTDNSNVQIWDIRRPERYNQIITGYRGPVFALDWHPRDKNIMVTASRDCTMKVWQIDYDGDQARVTSSIDTIAPMTQVKWSPENYFQLASCYLTTDSSAVIWDVQRPSVPILSFPNTRETTSGILWRPMTNSFIALSKDNNINHYALSKAIVPREASCPVPVASSCRNYMAYATPTRSANKERALQESVNGFQYKPTHLRQSSLTLCRTPSTPVTPSGTNCFSLVDKHTSAPNSSMSSVVSSPNLPTPPPLPPHNLCSPSNLPTLSPPIPTLMPHPIRGNDINLEIQNFPPPRMGMMELSKYPDIGPVLSHLYISSDGDSSEGEFSAKVIRDYSSNYKMEAGDDLYAACQHNAAIAARNGMSQEAALWQIISTVFVEDFTREKEDVSLLADTSTLKDVKNSSEKCSSEGTNKSRINSSDVTVTQDVENKDSSQMNTSSQYVPHTDLYFCEDYSRGDYMLASGAPVKSSLGGSLARGNRSKYRPNRDLGANEINIEDRSEAFSVKGFDFFGSGKSHQTSLENVNGEEFIDADVLSKEQSKLEEVLKCSMPIIIMPDRVPVVTPLDFSEEIISAFKETVAVKGDIITPVTAMMLLSNRLDSSSLSPHMFEHWVTQLLEQLDKLELFNKAAVIRNDPFIASRLPHIYQMNQYNTSLEVMCPHCRARFSSSKNSFVCLKCKNIIGSCSWCGQVVRGLFVWCQGCGHGGHLHHTLEIRRKLQENKEKADRGRDMDFNDILSVTKNSKHRKYSLLDSSHLCPAGCGHLCQYM